MLENGQHFHVLLFFFCQHCIRVGRGKMYVNLYYFKTCYLLLVVTQRFCYVG